MKALVSGFKWIINFFKTVWSFVGNILKGIVVAFQILGRIVTLAMQTILTLPPWIQGFLIITITITIVYFIVGRQAGKSDEQ